jgi:peptidoglycan hydrolase CwlO-like protein
MFRKLAIAIFLAIILWGGFFPSTASSQLVESRLNNLESDLNRIESRLNSIESQLGRNPSSPRTAPNPSQPSRVRRTQTQSERSMFNNLATLVIELKQQVNTLEARVKKLEGKKE